MNKTDGRFDPPQGTLDRLIIRVVALGPIHGYAIAQRIQQILATPSRSSRDPAIPRCIATKIKSCSALAGKSSETGWEAKFYELTSKGQTHFKVETGNWTRLTDVVSLILEGTLEGI